MLYIHPILLEMKWKAGLFLKTMIQQPCSLHSPPKPLSAWLIWPSCCPTSGSHSILQMSKLKPETVKLLP